MMTRDLPTATRMASFEQVALGEIPVLYRVARRLTRNNDDAEDLVGTTLYQGAKAWERFDGRHARAWLIRILRNAHLGEIRRQTSRPEETLGTEIDSSYEGFWKVIDWRLAGGRVMEELDKLPEDFRLAVALVDVEEMGHAEAADALGIPEATLRTRLFRGRKRLRASLAHLGVGL